MMITGQRHSFLGKYKAENDYELLNDADLVDEIVKRVLQRLNQSPQGDLHGLVGIHGPIEKLVSLCTESVILGLWGMGGVGKTTLATAVFNRLCDGFEGFCFLNNVRERAKKYGIDHLKTELSKLLKEEDASPFVTPGGITNFAKKRLGKQRFLLFLMMSMIQIKLKIYVEDIHGLGQVAES
ncbi:hypothetical protein S83_061333 [Arachis hypogaea]